MSPVSLEELVQGTILAGLCVFFLDSGDNPPSVPSAGTDPPSESTASMSVSGALCKVVVISQTCDIRSNALARNMIQVAPVYPLSVIDNENQRNSIKRSEPFHALYIASEDGYVDLRIICTVSKRHLGHAQRAGELTAREQEHLRVKLLHWFARPAIEDEVAKQLAVIDKLVRKKMPKAALDSELCHLFLALTDDSVELLVVHRGNPRSDSVALIDEAAAKATAAGARKVTCRHKREAEVTLAEIQGMMRFAFDYLSFDEPTSSSWRAYLGQ